MSGDKFTPGPWRIFDQGDRPGIEAKHETIIVFGEGAEDAGIFGASRDEALANARLIAAAPDMLAALERVMTLKVSVGGDELFGDVQAAIAKARGQS